MLISKGDRYQALVCVAVLVMMMPLRAAEEKTSIDAYRAKPAAEKIKLITSIADRDASLYGPAKKSEILKLFHDLAPGKLIPNGVKEVNAMAALLAKSPDSKTPDIETLVDQYIELKFGVPSTAK